MNGYSVYYMGGSFVLPLFPLRGAVLLPGETVRVPASEVSGWSAVRAADGFGGAMVAALMDGDSVHEVGVTAVIKEQERDELELRGVNRCRLLSLVDADVPLVKAERFPEKAAAQKRSAALNKLLRRRFRRLCRAIGKSPGPSPERAGLSTLTWRVAATLDLTAEQQQGFLNVPDALTRGKLLLVVVRELEKRERFLRRWAHLRTAEPWN